MGPTITQEQAEQRVLRYITSAMAAIGTGRLEEVVREVSVDTEECTTFGYEPTGRFQVAESYFIRGVPTGQNPQVFGNFLSWVHREGFRIRHDEQNPERWVSVENKEGFRMTLQESADGNQILSIGASSPCVWPDGTPEPEPEPTY